MPFVSRNPSTGRRLRTFARVMPSAVAAALRRSQRAQKSWEHLGLTARSARCSALARALRQARDRLASLATAEMGKPITQARAEIEKSATLCDYYARHGATLLDDEHPVAAPPKTRVTFAPLGTVLAIMPWNFPIWQVIRAVVPALLAGNTVLLKPAANVATTAFALEELFHEASFAPGVFQVLLVETAAIPALIADPRIHAVTLTGSTQAGRTVAALAGAALKPGIFELGGSDPAIVLADADLARAAEISAQSRLFNSGQSCVCAKRFIVVRAVAAEFTRQFTACMAARRVGDPTDAATEVGPLARADLRAQLHRQVSASVALGAKIILGGHALPGPGFFYAPTVLTQVRPGMPAFAEEMFGPVAAIIAVRDAAEALRVANDSPYGLAATVFTSNPATARQFAQEIAAGSVFINELARSTPELPFGGIKASGFGREMGAWGARAFVNVKTIWDS